MKNRILIALLVSILSLPVWAQQDPMLSQYMFNGLFLNPAYAGSHNYKSSSLLYRTQWVNLEGAPQTTLLSVDGPLAKENMGLGLVVSNDRIGVTSQTDVFVNYAYHLKVAEGHKLAMGIKGGVSHYNAQLSELTVWDEGDAVFGNDVSSQMLPKFGIGLFYYSDKAYAGLSVPTLLAYQSGNKFNLDINKSSRIRKHYVMTAGYVHQLSEKFKFKPSFLLKYTSAAPIELDLNFAVMYDDAIWFGTSYRSGDAIVGIVEYQANKRFRVGYSFDVTTSKLRGYSSGTHEIMLGYDFGKDLLKIKTPRFF